MALAQDQPRAGVPLVRSTGGGGCNNEALAVGWASVCCSRQGVGFFSFFLFFGDAAASMLRVRLRRRDSSWAGELGGWQWQCTVGWRARSARPS